MNKLIVILLCMLCTTITYSQDEDELITKGIEYAQNGETEKAFEFFNKAINLNPNEPSSYANRANVYLTRRQYDLALQDFTKSIELGAEDLNIIWSRADIYLALKDYENAIKDYSVVIAYNPSAKGVYYERAFTYFRLGNFENAKKDLESQLEITPRDYKSLINLIKVKKKLGLYEEAILDYEKVIQEFPNHSEMNIFYYDKSNINQILNRLELALKDANKAIEFNNNYAHGFLNRAGIYLKLKDTKNACIDFARALELGVEQAPDFAIDRDFENLKTACN